MLGIIGKFYNGKYGLTTTLVATFVSAIILPILISFIYGALAGMVLIGSISVSFSQITIGLILLISLMFWFYGRALQNSSTYGVVSRTFEGWIMTIIGAIGSLIGMLGVIFSIILLLMYTTNPAKFEQLMIAKGITSNHIMGESSSSGITRSGDSIQFNFDDRKSSSWESKKRNDMSSVIEKLNKELPRIIEPFTVQRAKYDRQTKSVIYYFEVNNRQNALEMKKIIRK
jgi:hypothetical protein